jgi:putative selenium metabolism protein SsnA
MTTIVRNGTVVTCMPGISGASPVVLSGGAVAFEGDRIVGVGRDYDIGKRFTAANVLDARGGIIVPGFVNLHHHFYSALARGLDPGQPMKNFSEVLDVLWWRLDRALDEETVRLSAQLSVADCIRWGCTTVFDHHASPSFVDGSLDVVGHAVEESGLSALLCYEVTNRNGPAEARSGIAENLRFIEQCSGNPRLKGVFGLHASFTVTNDTLKTVADGYQGGGCHIHVAEDPVDVTASLVAFGKGPVERLEEFGLLDKRSLLAHGIHLTDGDYRKVAEHGGTIIHNPESNANNSVGRLDVPKVSSAGVTVGLGTDGMSSSMLRALRAAFLNHRSVADKPDTAFQSIPDLLGNNVNVARRYFDEPLLGELKEGAPADLVVMDASEITPLDSSNLFGHIAYGLSESRVRHTVARGKTLLEDFEHCEIDVERLTSQARAASPELWTRFRAIETGTRFLGPDGKNE